MMSVPGAWQCVRKVLVGGGAAMFAVSAVAGCTSAQPDPGGATSAPGTRTAEDEVLSLARVVDASPLDPGRYLVSVSGAPSPAPLSPVLMVPAGYERIEASEGVRTADFDRYLWVWDVKSVYADPCQDAAGSQVVGTTVADLADALAAQQGRTGTPAPVPVTVGGHDGLYLELTVPADAEPDDCPDRGYYLWPGRYQQLPGQVDRIWVVDVDGHRIVFDASHSAGTAPAAVAELVAMVTSATFAAAADR